MSLKCVVGAAGSGKTTWVVQQALKLSAGLARPPRLIVPSRLLAADLEMRLADQGGALGVRVGTLADLADEILIKGQRYPILLPEVVRKKLLREVVQNLSLMYYQAIRDKPGFISHCLSVISELKAGAISPQVFLTAVKDIGGNPRLAELGLVYQAYQQALRKNGWADPAGMVWMAAEILEERGQIWQGTENVFLDGFDDLSPAQLRMVAALANQVSELRVTLTGALSGEDRGLVHKRFNRLRSTLEGMGCEVLDLRALQMAPERELSSLQALEAAVFSPDQQGKVSAKAEIDLVAVPDREAEIRTSLRWIRKKIVSHSLRPGEAALLMRDLEPYRLLADRIAREYSLPLRILGGLPLFENPAVAAVWSLIKAAESGREGLAWYDVIKLWRSPYFSWRKVAAEKGPEYSREEQLEDARSFEEVARWGRVIKGYAQWKEAFALLVDRQRGAQSRPGLPQPEAARKLWERFARFAGLVDRQDQITSLAAHISWLEDLLGGNGQGEEPGLNLKQNILLGPPDLVERDWRALKRFNGILGEMIAAEELLGSTPVTFPEFAAELKSLLKSSSYQPLSIRDDAILCADCTQARGMPFKAAAVVGLAEGEFPRTIREDPFLRDDDRALLAEVANLPLRMSVDSAEAEYFYEAVTRPTTYLLLTRPRIADNGAPWQPSPYWEEIDRLVDQEALILTATGIYPADQAASWSEYLERLALSGANFGAATDVIVHSPQDILVRIMPASEIIKLRLHKESSLEGRYEGDLSSRAGSMQARFPEDTVWSASRLESYQTCPYKFFIGNLLGLEPAELPEEGLDGRQLGNIYHRILEDLYNAQEGNYQLQDLLAELPAVAGKIFQTAPQHEGFRETAWWDQTQKEILTNLRLSLIVLENLDPDYKFLSAEQRFGIGSQGQPHLEIEVPGGGKILLRGLIDRVDSSPDGDLRIVDYKTAGPSGFSNRAVLEGQKLQLPLYALAAEQMFGLGRVREGFYFHVQAAQPSGFCLSSFKGQGARGPQAAMDTASRRAWEAVTSIRQGIFGPIPPPAGCPEYCPALGFCWKYRPRRW